MTKKLTNEVKAVRLLRRYDTLRTKLQLVERELTATCRAYGREQGYMAAYSPDALRTDVIAGRVGEKLS